MAKGTIGLGQYRGKVGGQVLRVVDGKQVMQAYQPVVVNPNTLAQVKQRSAMQRAGRLARGFLAVIRETYSGRYHAGEFIKRNIGRTAGAIVVDAPWETTVNYGMLKITDGSASGLLWVETSAIDYGEAEHLNIYANISGVSINPALNQDNVKLHLVVYCPELNVAMQSAAVAADSHGIGVEVPAIWDGMEVYTWIYASAAVNDPANDAYDQTSLRLPKIFSEANYIGTGEVH